MDEQRIIELETRLAYQEQTLSDLNDAVAGQQQQLSRVEHLIESLKDRVAVIAESLSDSTGQQDQRPPHY